MSSIDGLGPDARMFYEQTKQKMLWSIILGAVGLLSLAYCSAYGGQSNSASYVQDATDDPKYEKAQEALVGGYGFASFLFILAFLVFVGAAIYNSPVICGTPREAAMITGREQGTSSDAGVSSAPPARAAMASNEDKA
ncbi:hypothetical protein B484DRAFT_443762 [Ochromonadaceae sp. CCMP2298]|nr:hypothetical protein B484DRAFT_443762 [Ochromonadaceae sp. CCMP2298]